ncbi:hypothetical protein A5760_11325 [Mycobacterium colombiense]|uniref:Uncharacterized protein n=1 Tax=Mycobacterium colombiense TaxID=339268 RepID=A0A1A0VJ59_9MYCO|nr:hypothetical protein [Mycobacterium colombiense]OBB83270.1 hypothetical protein A5760_11325 [Mycobacterium colombiense]
MRAPFLVDRLVGQELRYNQADSHDKEESDGTGSASRGAVNGEEPSVDHKRWITYQLIGMIDVCEQYGETLARRSQRKAGLR